MKNIGHEFSKNLRKVRASLCSDQISINLQGGNVFRRATITGGALLSTIVLVSGSAAAQPASSPDDVGTAQQLDVVINEVGVDMSSATGVQGTFVELKNTTEQTVSLENWSLSACDTTNFFTFVTFGPTYSIPPRGFFLIADDVYAGSGGPFRDLAGNLAFLEQGDGGLALADDSATPLTDDVKWGSPAFPCSFFVDAGVTPDDDNSLQLNTAPPPTWCALPPTPKAVNGSC